MGCSSHIAPVWGQNHQSLRALQITIKLISAIWKNVRILPFPLFWAESQKNKVNVALNGRFKITGTKICRGFVLYSTVQLFNSLFQVLGPGTKYRSPELWILSLQVILGFVQAVLCPCPAPEETCTPQICTLFVPVSLSEPISWFLFAFLLSS